MKIVTFPFKSVCMVVLCLALTCPAATVFFGIDLDGLQADAARGTGSPARGSGAATLNTANNLLEWDIGFDAGALIQGAGSVTAAHFHAGRPGVSGPIITPPGAISGANPMRGTAIVSDETEALLLRGEVYVNVHTSAFPGGEIRGQVIPDRVLLGAVQDNTLFESNSGSLSNGAGQYLFTGNDRNGNAKRALVRFDLGEAGLPAGARITEARLTLNMSKTIVGSTPITLHRVSRAWGEGSSNASSEEGAGASARTGDATWIHTRFNTERWDRPGGDFSPVVSATTRVSGVGKYTWQSTPEMVADLEAWLQSPDENFGWLLLGSESGVTAKRFDAREHPNANNRPQLEVLYSLPCPFTLQGDLNGDCKVDFQDLSLLTGHWLVDCTQLPLDAACREGLAE